MGCCSSKSRREPEYDYNYGGYPGYGGSGGIYGAKANYGEDYGDYGNKKTFNKNRNFNDVNDDDFLNDTEDYNLLYYKSSYSDD